MRTLLSLIAFHWVVCVHCVILLEAQHIMCPRQRLILINLVEKCYLKFVLFILIFATFIFTLVRTFCWALCDLTVYFTYGVAKSVESLRCVLDDKTLSTIYYR